LRGGTFVQFLSFMSIKKMKFHNSFKAHKKTETFVVRILLRIYFVDFESIFKLFAFLDNEVVVRFRARFGLKNPQTWIKFRAGQVIYYLRYILTNFSQKFYIIMLGPGNKTCTLFLRIFNFIHYIFQCHGRDSQQTLTKRKELFTKAR